MKKLNAETNELCREMARLFERSPSTGMSSPLFVRRIMLSTLLSPFYDMSYPYLKKGKEEILEEVSSKYGKDKGTPVYPSDVLYWMGYVYLAVYFLRGMGSREAYREFPPSFLLDAFPIYHTYSIEGAVERLFEVRRLRERDILEETKKAIVQMAKRETILESGARSYRFRASGEASRDGVLQVVIEGLTDAEGNPTRGYFIPGEGKRTDPRSAKAAYLLERNDAYDDALVLVGGKIPTIPETRKAIRKFERGRRSLLRRIKGRKG